ncbi:unnamed protein product [Rhodiola kirilowii]
MDIYYVLGETPPVTFPTKTAVYVWGYNYSGQTAREDKEHNLRIPKQLRPKLFGSPAGANARWLDIACGREHTAAVASDGSLFTWGANDFGQLGDGTEKLRKYPKKLKLAKLMEPSPPGDSGFGDKIRDLIIRDCFGGPSLQIRRKPPMSYSPLNLTPHRFTSVSSIRDSPFRKSHHFVSFIMSTNRHSVSTTSSSSFPSLNGSIAAADSNAESEQGSSIIARIHCTNLFLCFTVIRQVSCGQVHVVPLSEDGRLQAWGYNEYGQLGRGVTGEGLQGARVISAYAKFLDEAPEHVKITSVSCGEYHTAAISDNGDVSRSPLQMISLSLNRYTWGLGSMGQLGHCSLQYGDKELLPRRVVSLDGIFVKEVACGGVHTCAVTEKGALYAWGGGQAGQLGLGIQGWGYNSYGQAANDKTTYAWFPSPVDWCVGEVKKLSAGGGHSAVLTDASSLKELCEFRLADCVTISNAHEIEDAALRTGEHHRDGGDSDYRNK